MTKISQLTDIGAGLAAGDEFIVRDVSDASVPNKKITANGFIDYVIAQGVGAGFTQIAAGVGPLARVLASSSGATGALAFSTAAATTLIERARIDSSGRLLVGTSSARSTPASFPGQARLQLEGDDNNDSAFSITNTTNSLSGRGPNIRTARIRGTGIVVDADTLGHWSSWGYDGSDFIEAAGIRIAVDGTPGANDMPGRLVFSTTADGAASPTERMRIKAAGTINFSNVATYADNAAATSGGLAVGDVYRTSTGQLMIRY